MAATRYGADPGDWEHFDFILGLGQDLLPVVSNPHAAISPMSRMKALGKTPSRYNASRQVSGITEWTSLVATEDHISRWSKEPDFGICIQTRRVRAIDVDVPDPTLAKEIRAEIIRILGRDLPARTRKDSSKYLLVCKVEGSYSKRSFPAEHGIVEFLADGQQFIACGTHTAGARYEWSGGLPLNIPTLTAEEYEAVWSGLLGKFAVGAGTVATASVKAEKLAAVSLDPNVIALQENGLVLLMEKDGRVHITCPFDSEHTSDGGVSSTTYFPPRTNGFEVGHFHCLHAHCADRSDDDFLEAIGVKYDPKDDYEVIDPPTAVELAAAVAAEDIKRAERYNFIDAADHAGGKPPEWLVKDLFPLMEFGIVYGPPGAGKSFWMYDVCECISQGLKWNGKRVKQGMVLYIAAEGAGGFRLRIAAYRKHHGIDAKDRGIKFLLASPNLMSEKEALDLAKAIKAKYKPILIVYDTLARGSVGGEENSARDMGMAVSNCQTIYKETGAMVVLLAHTGKDISKGMRGSTAPKGAADVQVGIFEDGENRTAWVEKLKDLGKKGQEYGFTLFNVDTGVNEYGETYGSCIVEHCDVAPRKVKDTPMGNREHTIWPIIKDMVDPLASSYPTMTEVAVAAHEQCPEISVGNFKNTIRGIEKKRGWINIVNEQIRITEVGVSK